MTQGKAETPLEAFKRSTTAALRAIAERDDVNVVFSSDPPGAAGTRARVPLPSRDLPPEEAAQPLAAAWASARAEREALVLAEAARGLDITRPLAWSGTLPAEGGGGRILGPGFAILLPPGTVWVQWRARAERPVAVHLALRPLEGGTRMPLGPFIVPPDGVLHSLSLPIAAGDGPLLLEGRWEADAPQRPAPAPRLLDLACGGASGVRVLNRREDAASWLHRLRPGAWHGAATRAGGLPLPTQAPPSRSLANWLRHSQAGYAALLVPLEESPAGESLAGAVLEALPPAGAGPRLLALVLESRPAPGLLPPVAQALVARADHALAVQPGPWRLEEAPGGVLSALAGLRQDRLSARRLARGRAALGLERSYLLVAALDQPGPPPEDALLRALAEAAAVDLVLAGRSRARLLSPLGAVREVALPLAALLCAAGPECRALWLPPSPARPGLTVEERALLALAAEAGVPALAAGAPGPGGEAAGRAALEALLRDPALRARQMAEGQGQLAALLRRRASWPG